jgi:2-oxoglutarate ferredoxin oxidoreductase subunit delta
MAGRIIIDTNRCKGCGLCITVCPKSSIEIAEESNPSGYFPAKAKNEDCTACSQCAIVCPEGIIEVVWDESDQIRIVTSGAATSAPPLIEEKK